MSEAWYAVWPPRPPRDDEACPTCGYGLGDGTETEHECPPGFLLLLRGGKENSS